MVKLTEEMVVARTRISDFSAVKKLNCWGSELTDVSLLRKMQNVEVLSFSVNNINTLADFQYCLSLQDLFVRKNNIKDLNEVCYLQNLPNLRNLWLGENPCAEREGYRLAVLKALPNLEKLDDTIVSPEEIQTAMARGRTLVHPLDMDASPPQSDAISPERSFEEPQNTQEEYHDRRNANYNASPSHHYSQNNQYAYEDYDERPAVSRHNGDYEERQAYSEYSNNDLPQRGYAPTSPRTQYAQKEHIDDRRSDRNSYDYDNRIKPDYEEHHENRIKSDYDEQHQPPPQSRRIPVHHNIEREDPNQVHGWVRHSEKEKCRSQFHYHRRPVTRNSNILSAVLCLVKELDYPSLEVVEMAGTVAFTRIGSISSIPSPEFSDSLDSTITPCQCVDGEANYNNPEHHVVERQHVIEDNTERRPTAPRRNGCADSVTVRSPKNVSIDPSPRYLGSNQCVYKLRDSVPDNLMSAVGNYEERKGNDVRRVASSDSIPRGGYNGVLLSPACRVLSQDCMRRSKSPDVRNTIAPLRYIQSAKGTWTYNLGKVYECT
ncbi:hypothetical protein KM043_011929 [Ampulex compressa]|nr:hypothetical protein KM043_011929 [Ampulex compressa]